MAAWTLKVCRAGHKVAGHMLGDDNPAHHREATALAAVSRKDI